MATPNPTIAFVTAASAAYTALAELAKSGGNTNLATACETVRDALDMMGDGDDGESATSLLCGTLKPAAFCRDAARHYADMAEHDDDAESYASSTQLASDLTAAAAVFASLGR